MFKNLSIRAKTVLIILLVTILATATGFSLIAWNDIKIFKEELVTSTISSARLVGHYCVSALVFNDPSGAKETLGKLKTFTHIAAVRIYNEKNALFASYQEPLTTNLEILPLQGQKTFHCFKGNFLHVMQPIPYRDQVYGTIYMIASTEVLRQKLNRNMVNILLITLAAFFLAVLLAARLQIFIAKPISSLAALMEKVSRENDYSVRVQNAGKNEIGTLYDGFNNMLDQIQFREARQFKAESMLRESETWLKTILDTVQAGIVVVDVKTRKILDINHQAAKMFGAEKDAILQRICHKYICPAEEKECPVIDLKQGVDNSERVLLRSTGEKLPIIKTVIPVTLNERACLVESFIDIKERKMAEEQIVRQNKFLLDVLNSLTHPFYVIDTSTYRIVMANPAAKLNELDSTSTCYKLTHQSNKPCNTSHHPCPLFEVKKSKKSLTVEHIHIDESHNNRNLEIHAYPIFDDAGDVCQIIEYAIDVTERRLAEERHRSIFENAIEGIFQSTPEGRFISVNPAFAEIYGFESPEEVIASIQNIDSQMYVYPKQREEIIALLWKQGTVKNFETQHYRKDGSIIWVTINIHVCRNRADNPLFFEGTCQDITEQKKLEAQLLQSQKMEAVGKLAGGIAHDFNNLLTSIIGNTELLIYKRKKNDITSQRLNTILETADRASQLTRQLLMLSRRQMLNQQMLNLNELILGMKKMLERIMGEDIQFQFLPDSDIRLIKADAMSMEQVVLNLVVNARQAMPHGGILCLQTENIHLEEGKKNHLTDSQNKEFVRLTVSDTGVGIPKEVLKDIFEPFFTTKVGGTGLGLSIVNGIVKQAGGFIDIYTELRKGSSFKIYLPAQLMPDNVQNSKTVPQEKKPNAGTETILVVEDDLQILEVIRTVLHDLHYSVLTASSGEDALKMVEKKGKRIDLVLTDIILPGVNGGQVAKMIRSKFPDMCVLFMSGYPDERIALTDIIRNSDQFIEKPFNTESLVKKIRTMLDLKKNSPK